MYAESIPGLTISEIARRSGLDRKTVRKYLQRGRQKIWFISDREFRGLKAPASRRWIEDDKAVFLKTVYPSRKFTAIYLTGDNHD